MDQPVETFVNHALGLYPLTVPKPEFADAGQPVQDRHVALSRFRQRPVPVKQVRIVFVAAFQKLEQALVFPLFNPVARTVRVGIAY